LFSRFFSKCCLITLVFLKIGTVDDNFIHISCRMQGFPLEYHETIPPNSPEDTYREEVQNYLDVRSVATPLIENTEGVIVVVQKVPNPHANPSLKNPHNPLLLRVDFSGNIVVEYYPRLPSIPYEECDMEPEQPNFNKEFTTPFLSTKMVDPQQNLIHLIWRTPSCQYLYEKFNFNRPLFNPPHTYATTGVDAGPSSQPIDHIVEQIINTATTSGQVTSET